MVFPWVPHWDGTTLPMPLMRSMEEQWFANCPRDFRPLFYKRYVDDSLLNFRISCTSRVFSELFISNIIIYKLLVMWKKITL